VQPQAHPTGDTLTGTVSRVSSIGCS